MSVSINVAKTVSEKIAKQNSIMENLLCSAIEGGSNYWYCIDDHNKKEIPECECLSALLMCEGSWMVISDAEESDAFETKKVTHVDVLKAWHTFSTDTKYKRHYSDALVGNDDAATGDVFFQLVVLGEVIFG